MSWECPNCGREFAKPQRSHSCESRALEAHFENVPDDVLLIYASLMEKVEALGRVTVSPVKNAILVAAKTNFLSIKPKRKALDIEYLLDRRSEEEFANKIFQISKNRFAHFVRLANAGDVTPELIAHLRASYELASRG